MVLINILFLMDSLLILLLAFVIDLIFGEFPDRVHPTVWMGNVIAYLKPKTRSINPLTEKRNGVFLCVGVITLFTVPAFFLLWAIRLIPVWGWLLYVVASAVLLKTTIAIKCMKHYTAPIAKALKNGDVDEARRWLHFIVRRDPATLDERHIISAAVESIAESTTDGVTSPLFFFALFGVPGAFAFRVINTLDSMVGYRDTENVNIGWFSAKMDTIANYAPARLTAFLMVVSAMLMGADWRNSLRILQRDKNKTASLNAGWTISAMAGALNTQLEKQGYYALGDGEDISPEDVGKAWRIMLLTAVLFSVAVVAPVLALKALLL
ncbi:cobalamin biosynthesis protein [Candidatus Bathyarchaeota archaeon A05DMB-2]|jgi:adenosylcobinamide-phosphate synthase|nr:cobalamin biosynthesis protein [Candidatus Bathyarchaeota archaeon A05DMB-2]